MNPSLYSFLVFILFLILCFSAAGLGSLFTSQSVNTWYAGLQKPFFNPPNWVFGPVWSFLYFTMAIAAWMIWNKGGLTNAKWPLIVFLIQLGFNVLWSVLFFGMQKPGWAFIEIIILWIAIFITMVLFWNVSKPAGLLLIPYFLWTGFAAILNYTLWQLNQ